MKSTRRLILIGLAGILLAGAALWYRSKANASKAAQLARMVADPRFKKMDAEVARRKAAVAADPHSVEAKWNLARIYQDLGVIDLAAVQLRDIVAMSPQDEAATIALANAELALVHPDAAKLLLTQATSKWPKNPEGWQGLAVIAYSEQHYEDAVRLMRRAVSLRPNEPNYRYILANSLQAYAQQFPTSDTYAPILALARHEYEKILPSWPDKADIHVRLASVCTSLTDYKSGVEHYAEAVKLLPGRPDIAAELAAGYISLGKYDLAKTAIDEAILRGTDYATLYDLRGQILMRATDQASTIKAAEAYQKAITLNPKVPRYYERLGTLQSRLGKYPQARVTLERAVEMDPERAAPYQQLAAVYTRLGDSKMASRAARLAQRMVFNEQQLKQIEQLSASDPQDMNLHLVLADRYRDLGMTSSAIAKYRLILKYEPGNKRAQEGLAAIAKSTVARSGAK